MNVSVVEADIPLLFGLDYQKLWGMVIDVSENKIIMKKFNKTFEVRKKNHYWTLPISDENVVGRTNQLVLVWILMILKKISYESIS